MSTDSLDKLTEYHQKTMALRYKVIKLSWEMKQFLEAIESMVDLPFTTDATELLNNEKTLFNSKIDLALELRRIEVDFIKLALKQCRGKQVEAANLLGMSATTLNSKIKRYKIELSK